MFLLEGHRLTKTDVKEMCGEVKYVSNQESTGSNAASIILL